jgi:hypothetical protein
VGRFNTVDRFAPKYASLNPYQYGANNPIKYIDVNGDSLRINTGGGNYAYYNNGALTNQDGTQYTGPGTKVRNNGSIKLKGELKSAVRSLNTIGSGVAGGELVSQIVGSTSTVTINSGDANSTLELSVTWNSSSLEGGLDERGSTSGPTYVGLAHELAHSLDNINGNKPGSIWETVNGKRVYNVEKGASNFENRIRNEHGLPLRAFYGTTDYPPLSLLDGRSAKYPSQYYSTKQLPRAMYSVSQ